MEPHTSLPPSGAPDQSSSDVKRRIFIGLAIVIVLLFAAFFVFKDPAQKTTPNSTPANGAGRSEETKQDKLSLSSIMPCTLLSAQDRSAFKLGVGETENKRTNKGCGWEVPLDSPSDPNNLYIHISIYPDGPLDGLPALGEGEPQPLTIGSHDARQAIAPQDSVAAGTCAIDLAAKSSDKGAIRVTANGSTAEKLDFDAKANKYCGIAKQIAQIIEPQLP